VLPENSTVFENMFSFMLHTSSAQELFAVVFVLYYPEKILPLLKNSCQLISAVLTISVSRIVTLTIHSV
jgi:hypothetical protein